jgi:hypothetical protein
VGSFSNRFSNCVPPLYCYLLLRTPWLIPQERDLELLWHWLWDFSPKSMYRINLPIRALIGLL